MHIGLTLHFFLENSTKQYLEGGGHNQPTPHTPSQCSVTTLRGGSSKLIERGSDRVKGASGVFRMREKGARRSVGQKSPSGVRGKAPVRGLGDEVPRS